MTTDFGALRELLNQPGTHQTWRALIEWLEAQDDDQWLDEVAIPYCLDHLKHHWPAHIQVRSPRWQDDARFGQLGHDPLWCFEQHHRSEHITPDLHTQPTTTHTIDLPDRLYRRGQMRFEQELIGGYTHDASRVLLAFHDATWLVIDVLSQQIVERGQMDTQQTLFCATWHGPSRQLVAITQQPHTVIVHDFKTHQTHEQPFLAGHTLRDKHLFLIDEAHLLMQTASEGRLHIIMWHVPTAQAIYTDRVDLAECDQLRYMEPFNGGQYVCVGFNESYIISNPPDHGDSPHVEQQALDDQAITAIYQQGPTTYRVQFDGTISNGAQRWALPQHFAQENTFVDGTIRVDARHILLCFAEFPTITNEAVEYYFIVLWDLEAGQPTGCTSTNIDVNKNCEVAWDQAARCMTLIDVFENQIETHWFDPPPPVELDEAARNTTHSVLVRANRRLLESYHTYGPTDANNSPWVEAIDNEDERMFMEWLPAQRGATAEAIQQAEARLGITLPGLYRHQMSIANGWPLFHTFPCYTVWELYPVEALHWAHENEQFMARLAAQTEDVPTTHALSRSLIIGLSQDGADHLLLDPHMQTPRGGWRVWEANSEDDVIAYTTFWKDYQQFISGALYDEDLKALVLTR